MMPSWWDRNKPSIDATFLSFLVFLLLLLALMVLSVRVASAEDSMAITVPPQAVIGQPDGDTFDLFTFNVPSKVAIRVHGINTPEMSRKKGAADEPGAREAKDFTGQWLARGPFRVTTIGRRSFERIEAIVDRQGETLAEALRKAGLGK